MGGERRQHLESGCIGSNSISEVDYLGVVVVPVGEAVLLVIGGVLLLLALHPPQEADGEDAVPGDPGHGGRCRLTGRIVNRRQEQPTNQYG